MLVELFEDVGGGPRLRRAVGEGRIARIWEGRWNGSRVEVGEVLAEATPGGTGLVDEFGHAARGGELGLPVAHDQASEIAPPTRSAPRDSG